MSVSRNFGHNGSVPTLFLLIRHGQTDVIGKRITGRLPGVRINKEGLEQAQRLAGLHADVIFSSPLERAVQTASPLAAHRGLEIRISEAFSEVDFGDWSGLTLEQLDAIPEWKRFNVFRSTVRLPCGETMVEVQSRVAQEMIRMAAEWPDKTFAIFSHADVIKAAVAHYAGSPLDLLDRFEIAPASVTRIELHAWGPKILAVGESAVHWP